MHQPTTQSKSIALGVLAGVLLTIMLSTLLNLSTLGSIVVFVIAMVLCVIFQNLAAVFTVLFSSVVLHALVLTITTRLGIPYATSHAGVHAQFVLILGGVAFKLHNSLVSSAEKQLNFILDLCLLSSIWLFVRQFNVETALDLLSFLSGEDNAEWLSTAATMSSLHVDSYVNGASGQMVGPLLQLFSAISSPVDGLESSTILSTVVNTYLFLIFSFAFVFGRVAVERVKLKQAVLAAVVLGIVASWMATNILQVSLQRGHLTFLLAVGFVWLFVLSNHSNVRHGNRTQWTSLAAILGAALSWWPVVPPLIATVLWIERKHLSVLARQLLIKRSSPALATVIVLGFAGISGWFLIMRDVGTLPLSFREFITTAGGVDAPSQVFILISVVVFGVIATQSDSSDFVAPGFLLVYGLTLTAVSNFVGPTYQPGYSAQKAVLLGVHATSVLTVPAMRQVLIRQPIPRVAPALFAGLLAFWISVVGVRRVESVSAGTSAWGSQVLAAVEANPGSPVLCYGGREELRESAYFCSRLASALTASEGPYASGWRHLLLFGGNRTDDNLSVLSKVTDAKPVSNSNLPTVVQLDQTGVLNAADTWWYEMLLADQK